MAPHRRGKFARFKLHMPKPQRFAYLRLMTDALVAHERIETTKYRAKALSMWMEPMISWAKRLSYYNTNPRSKLVLQQKIERKFDRPETLEKLMKELVPRYKYRPGGYTRTIKTRIRYRDDAKMAYIELIDREGELRTPKPNRTKREEFNDEQWESAKRFLGPELEPEKYNMKTLGRKQRKKPYRWWEEQQQLLEARESLEKEGYEKVNLSGDSYARTIEENNKLLQPLLWKHAFEYADPSTIGDAYNARYSELETYIKKEQHKRKEELKQKRNDKRYEWQKSYGYPQDKITRRTPRMKVILGQGGERGLFKKNGKN